MSDPITLGLASTAVGLVNGTIGLLKEARDAAKRIVGGQVKGRNPFHGWQPVVFGDAEIEDMFSKQRIGQKIAELEDVIARTTNGELMIPLSSKAKQHLMAGTGAEMDFRVVVSASAPVGILDAVRTALLDWSLKLEKSGIKGDGMSFSPEERKKAHEAQAIYNIGTIQRFTGNMGSGSGNFSVQGNIINADVRAEFLHLIDQIESDKAALKLQAAEKKQLDIALDGLRREMAEKQPNPGKVRAFVGSIRNIAEGAAGSLVAQGILLGLAKLMS